MDMELVDQDAEDLSYSRDLLQRFANTRCGEEFVPSDLNVDGAEGEGDDGMELRLGLSLGGCFEMEARETRIVRSSSTAMIAVFPAEVDFALALSSAQLVRACSLPAEAAEVHVKRKEMQVLKRMEAKRKRLEKRGSSRLDTVGCGDRKEETDGDFSVKWVMGGGGGGSGGDEREARKGLPEAMPSSSLGFNGRGFQGSKISILNHSAVVQSPADAGQKPTARSPLPALLRSLKSLQEDDEVLKAMTQNFTGHENGGRNIMAEMPYVSAKGEGPNGVRVEGFLYKYRKGEEVRIVCVCHGNFHTPAEFVRHAGGGDVDHPLRHIVVNPSPPIYY